MTTAKAIGILAITLVAASTLAGAAHAQAPIPNSQEPLYIGSQRLPVQVRSTAVYERYEDDHGALSQLTLPLSVTLPLARNLGLTVHTQYVSTEGDSVAAVDGLGDTQLGLSYYRALGSGSAVFTVGLNLPSGQRALTVEEAETAFLVGQGFYGFSLASLGQGFSASPGFTYALPVGERVALGAGVSYHYRGPFQPRSDVADDYDPGDEVILTGGVDYRLSPATRLSLDLTYVAFATDTWGELEYRSGDVVAVTAQARTTWRLHEVHLVGRLRSKGDSERPVVAGTAFGADTAVPAQGSVHALAHVRVTERVRVSALAQARYYDASEFFDESKAIADLGLSPRLRLTPQVSVLGRARLSVGDVSGFAVGGGLAWSL